jgi:GDP/UDP-N,N'-diacetylbacillosamine 2-epimerase (hydrolysing)
MRKILYISGTRADYGLMKRALRSINRSMRLEIAVTGMHLMKEFGLSLAEIKKDGFKYRTIDAKYKNKNPQPRPAFIGDFIGKFAIAVEKNRPDLILVLGDRTEMLAAACAAVYLGIPVAHIHGGEVTSTVDEISRHAITKLANLHLVSTKGSRNRIIKMGEEPWRIHIVGAPGVETALKSKLCSKKELFRKFNLDPDQKLIIAIQHPVSSEIGKNDFHMKQTMDALTTLKHQSIVVYPNADTDGRKMIRVIEKYRRLPFIHIHRNIRHEDFLSLMKYADVMIGNSSSGIIEAASFHLPVVNIGIRQSGRERGCNVIDAGYSTNQILRALKKCLNDNPFKQKVARCKNPYAASSTGDKIAWILSKAALDSRLLQKTITY